eukprot:1568212-Amphidinium_carterae.2
MLLLRVDKYVGPSQTTSLKAGNAVNPVCYDGNFAFMVSRSGGLMSLVPPCMVDVAEQGRFSRDVPDADAAEVADGDGMLDERKRYALISDSPDSDGASTDMQGSDQSSLGLKRRSSGRR